jgi:hypothetical protein
LYLSLFITNPSLTTNVVIFALKIAFGAIKNQKRSKKMLFRSALVVVRGILNIFPPQIGLFGLQRACYFMVSSSSESLGT